MARQAPLPGLGVDGTVLELAVSTDAEDGWQLHGPLGGGAVAMRMVLVRLLWCAVRLLHGIRGMPAGWFEGQLPEVATISIESEDNSRAGDAATQLEALFPGRTVSFTAWLRERVGGALHPFAKAAIESDLEFVTDLFEVEADRSVTPAKVPFDFAKHTRTSIST